jgi:non-canonical poly(A) RNA polymerase PAPD5/7
MSKEKSTPVKDDFHCKDNLLNAFRTTSSGFHDALLTMAPELPKSLISVQEKLRLKKAALKGNVQPIASTTPLVPVVSTVPNQKVESKVVAPSETPKQIVPAFVAPVFDDDEDSSSDSSSTSDSSDDELSSTDSSEFDREFIQVGSTTFNQMNVPWIRKPYETDNQSLTLHEEIIDFYKFIQPTEAETKKRELTITRISEAIKKVAPDYGVEIYGSYAVNMMLPGSDIDFSITAGHTIPHNDSILLLRKIMKQLEPLCKPGSVELITARVNLIRFTDAETSQHGDISVQSGGAKAIETISKYSQRYPAFKYLAAIIKYFLKQRGLNEVYMGGISSFSTTLMIISHLQMHLSNYEEEYVATTSLGTLLIDFLALYGMYFQYERVAIEINSGGKYRPKNYQERLRDGDRMMIIDPNDSTNNVSGGSRYITDVLNSFKFAFWRLRHGQPGDLSVLSRIILIDQELVNRRVYVLGDTLFNPPKVDAPQVFSQRRDDRRTLHRHKERKQKFDYSKFKRRSKERGEKSQGNDVSGDKKRKRDDKTKYRKKIKRE